MYIYIYMHSYRFLPSIQKKWLDEHPEMDWWGTGAPDLHVRPEMNSLELARMDNYLLLPYLGPSAEILKELRAVTGKGATTALLICQGILV